MLYRELYKPHIAPVEGLTALLDLLSRHQVPMAIATSGIAVNIEFMFENVPIRQHFRKVVDSSYITKGKPNPEIFLKAAAYLDTPPEKCLVFEDAVVGITAARAAGGVDVGEAICGSGCDAQPTHVSRAMRTNRFKVRNSSK